jgi:oxalate decarboxylase
MPLSWASFNNAPRRIQNGGRARQVTQDSFAVADTISGVNMRLTSGGLREMHWHPNADEWQYWIKGKGQMTVFNTGPNAVTMDFNAGDIGYVKRNLGHYIKNTGDTDLQFLEVFRSPYFADVSLSDWISRTPPAMVAQHLNVSEATIAKFPKSKPEVMPE